MTHRRRVRRVGLLLGLLAAAPAAFAGSPAFAASQQVQLEDNSFVLPAVAVKPGESVTWTYPSTTEKHNVNFEDGQFKSHPDPTIGPWTSTRTFASAGSEGIYLYHCQNHGNPGRTGMSGVVYVNQSGTVPGAPPTASFTVSPGVAPVGENVSFNASATTTEPDDPIVRHEWDLDGNGSFEIDTGRFPRTALSYDTAGIRTVKLRVTDNQGNSNTTTRSLLVNDPPAASFTVAPSSAQTGQSVSFNGSASRDPNPNGSIARYEWDLDGNGSFETNTGATPTTSRSYATAATLTVKLRVTDDLGGIAETTRPLEIKASPAPPPPPPPIIPARPVGCSSLEGAKRTACMQKSCRTLKRGKRASCISRSCRYLKRSKRSSCIRKSCRSLKGSKRASCMRKSCRFLKGAEKRSCVRKHRRKS